MGFEKVLNEVSEVLNEKTFSNISELLDHSFNDIFKQLGAFTPAFESMQLPQVDLFDSSAGVKNLEFETSSDAVRQISESVVKQQKDAHEAIDRVINDLR